jgi:Protein of unknown function (DUF3631)
MSAGAREIVPFESPSRPFDALGCDLAELVRDQFTTYVAFHADLYDAEADLLTFWTLHTHVFGAAEATPYLLVTAPTPEAGKSRILDVAQHLVARPEVVVDPSAASLFRIIDHYRPTLLIDEIDQLHKSRPLRAVLNAGHRQHGGYVTRVETIDGMRVPVRYNVFAPKLLAGIAGRQLPLTGATLSRCIEIPIRKRKPSEAVAPFSHRAVRGDCEAIRHALADWAAPTELALLNAQPTLPEGLTDRQRDSWEALAAIADHLGRDWPLRARSAALRLSRHAVPQPDPGTQIIADMRVVWDQIEGSRAHTAALAETRNQLEDRRYSSPLSAHELSIWLQRFGIHPLPNPFRQGGKLGRGYERAAFTDAFPPYR